ncbi:SR-related and CTD-associated factor 4 [Callorhinchus milii]|uniref:SR-related CTD associated factor 4 n=1 Tax=Callorhinchus milii TaxID=7868 RepID=V9KAM0_CALMI|nr:SR-related and CTD-associated factor 4 [Callorhinchus milii]|eukprot:gi/632971600/ref/XP_007902250.1/ PREDICTED: splicing factor, arginine/serine-rich 15 [Callorhinchus milii]
MDAVNAFNDELFSLMELKPPISRAKMILITKAAIKAIKLYKHVVQIVEKFVKKCKPEFKVPGLYVIDSIVRQSRHQFGAEKDVFGPRFSKNITATFQYLYKCPFDEKSKIVRVLNLWQKNGVFRIEVIQPLLDMAAGTTATTAPPAIDSAANNARSPIPHPAPSQVPQITSDSLSALQQQLPNSDAFVAVAQLFQSTQGQQIQQILQNFQQPSKPQSPAVDNSIMSRVEAFTAQLKTAGAQPPEQKAAFDKKLLDRFDYDDEPEQVDDVKKEESIPSPAQTSFGFSEGMQPPLYQHLGIQLPNLEQFQQTLLGLQQDTLQQMPPPPNGQLPTYGMGPVHSYPVMPQAVMPPASVQSVFQPDYRTLNEPQQEVDMEIEKPDMQESKRHHMENRRSRTRSGSRSPKRRRSRSGSRSRRSRHKRSRSRSRERERRRHSPRSRSQERREREKERERRQKGLPSIKSKTVSVCSTTLWIGQLDKRATQQDVANLLEEFGQIESLNMIPPRGCAYIVMVHRQDAYRALQKLSRGTFKVNQKPIKIAWALTKGMKAEYKQFWDVELGVSYIPWDKVKPEELEVLCEGGMLDNETLCPDWKTITKTPVAVADTAENGGTAVTKPEEMPQTSMPLPVQMPGVQPISSVGRLHPPNFSALPPPTFNPGVPPPPPPPPPPPFMRPGFNPIQPPPGYLPPGSIPPMSAALPIGNTGTNIPTCDSSQLPDQEGPHSMTAFAGGPFRQYNTGNQGGTSHTPVTNVQPPSPGLLGARPGLIPLQRPPGVPPPHLQRFPVVPPRPLLPHLMHRGPPPPGPGGFGVPPPHGVRGPFPPQNLYGRPSAAEDRDGRQFRNDRHGFPPGRDRDQERFGRSEFRNRSFGGNRSESDNRDRYGNRQEDRDERQSGGRERWEWGRRSSERDRSRDSEERNRWSSGHRDSREKESRRDRDVDQRGKEKPEASVDEESEKDLRSNGDTQEEIIKPLDINPVAESAKEESESLNTDMKATYMKATEMVEMEPASSTKQPETENSGTTNEAQ